MLSHAFSKTLAQQLKPVYCRVSLNSQTCSIISDSCTQSEGVLMEEDTGVWLEADGCTHRRCTATTATDDDQLDPHWRNPWSNELNPWELHPVFDPSVEPLEDILSQSLSLSDHSDESPPMAQGFLNHNRFDAQSIGVPLRRSCVPRRLETPSPCQLPPLAAVQEHATSQQRHIFAPAGRAPPPKRAREMGEPKHSSGGDLFNECAGFIQQLGALQNTLPCCETSLEETQAVIDSPRQRCPNPDCQAATLPSGQPFSVYWDMLSALAKLRSISCSAASPVTHLKPSIGTSEKLLWSTPGAHTLSHCHKLVHTKAVTAPVDTLDCPLWPPSPTQHRTLPSTSQFMYPMHAACPRGMHSAASVDQLSSLDLHSQHAVLCPPGSGRSSSGTLASRTHRHTQHSSNHEHSHAAMTSPFPVHFYSSTISTDLTALPPKSFTAPVSAAKEIPGCSSGAHAWYSSYPQVSEHVFEPMHVHSHSQNAPTIDSAPVYIPPNELCPSGPLNAQAKQHLGTACQQQYAVASQPLFGVANTAASLEVSVGHDWASQTPLTTSVQRGDDTRPVSGAQKFASHASTSGAHKTTVAGQSGVPSSPVVPLDELLPLLRDGRWKAWPRTCIPGLCDANRGLQMHFAGKRHRSIAGVIELQSNEQLQVPVGGGLVGVHLEFAEVAARWCLPFVKPTGHTQQRKFSKATVNLTVSVHVSAIKGCAQGNAGSGTDSLRSQERTITLQVFVLRDQDAHSIVQQEGRLPRDILDHLRTHSPDEAQYKQSLRGVTRKVEKLRLDPGCQAPLQVEFRGLDFEKTNDQEKVYMFVAAMLQREGDSESAVPADNEVLAAELLVPTICVSKRKRAAGTLDYVEQAVTNLSYSWEAVSRAGLY